MFALSQCEAKPATPSAAAPVRTVSGGADKLGASLSDQKSPCEPLLAASPSSSFAVNPPGEAYRPGMDRSDMMDRTKLQPPTQRVAGMICTNDAQAVLRQTLSKGRRKQVNPLPSQIRPVQLAHPMWVSF